MFYKLKILNILGLLAYSTITLPSAVWIVAHFNQAVALEEAAKVTTAPHGECLRIISRLLHRAYLPAIMSLFRHGMSITLSCTLNINENIQTVPVRLSYLKDQFTVFWSQIAAATVVVVIPTLLIVLLFQKHRYRYLKWSSKE
ncbi:MAG: hypothetical protein ACLTAF_00685 [Blautia coccoides]